MPGAKRNSESYLGWAWSYRLLVIWCCGNFAWLVGWLVGGDWGVGVGVGVLFGVGVGVGVLFGVGVGVGVGGGSLRA